MKTIKIGNRELQYKVKYHRDDYAYYETSFYEGVEEYTRRKYILFGEKITKTRPILIFRIYVDIESIEYDKSQCRRMIMARLKDFDNRRTRRQEIHKGGLI